MSREPNPFNPAAPKPPVRRPTGITGRPPTITPSALQALAERFGVPALDIERVAFPLANLEMIPLEIARKHVVIPVMVRDDAICLAMSNPSERRVIEELEFVSGRKVFPYAASSDQLAWVIEQTYAARDRGEATFAGAQSSEPGAGVEGAAIPGQTSGQASSSPPEEISLDEGDLEDPDLGAGARPTGSPGPTLDSVFSPLEAIHGRTVLVVDDEEDIRKLLKRVLEEKGYRVLVADRGSTALAMVKQHVPDAIVLDAMLPELHGFDICRRIKASVKYGHIPILMISAIYRGWRFAEDLKSAYGVTAFIEKPFRIGDVVTALETMLQGASKADGRDPEELTAEAEREMTAGMACYKRGDIDPAIAHLERGIKLDPLSYRLHYHLALLVGRKGDVFRAIQELETAVDLHPRSFSALKNLAVLYQQAGFKHKAIEMWERAIGQSPDDETRGQIKEHLMSLL